MKNSFLLPALIVSVNLLLTSRAAAQTLTTLHRFSFGSDGAAPQAKLIISGNSLYGTTVIGTVFKVNTDGTGFTNLYSFSATSFDDDGNSTNSDGANPFAGLILSGNTLYGTASSGGIGGNGTVFAVNTDGTGFTNLHSFTALDFDTQTTNSDGANPFAGLILSGNTLYGTANNGGSSGSGTVFAVNTNGSGFSVLYSFTTSVRPYYTNSDGAKPSAGLILSGSTLYGTAQDGGSSGVGTVFALNTNGSGFTVLFGFTNFLVTGDGPVAGLVLSGNILYGTTEDGGSSGSGGTVFALNTNGSGFKVLHNFADDSDGDRPEAGLVVSGNTLYGTTPQGGTNESGTVFALNTDGSSFTTLHGFIGDTNGGSPNASLILSGNILYGTAANGGANFGSGVYGTVFSLTLPPPPQLIIIHSAANLILAWPTNAAGLTFTLQSTTNLVSAGWTNVAPTSVVVSGQNTVTNPLTGSQQFYRLSQ